MTGLAQLTEDTTDVNGLDRLRLEKKRAELLYHKACVRLLEAEIAEADASDTPRFNPAWKRGPHLSRDGRFAILAAYGSGMRPVDVAKLFQISEKASLEWHHKSARIHSNTL